MAFGFPQSNDDTKEEMACSYISTLSYDTCACAVTHTHAHTFRRAINLTDILRNIE